MSEKPTNTEQQLLQTKRGFLKGALWTEQEKEVLKREWRPSDRAGSFARIAQLTGRPLNGVIFQAWKLGLWGNPPRGNCIGEGCGKPLGPHKRRTTKYCSKRCKAIAQWDKAFQEGKQVLGVSVKGFVPKTRPLALRVSREELFKMYMTYGMTLTQIREKLNCGQGSLIGLINYYKLPRRGYVKRYVRIEREDKDKVIFVLQIASLRSVELEQVLRQLLHEQFPWPVSIKAIGVD